MSTFKRTVRRLEMNTGLGPSSCFDDALAACRLRVLLSLLMLSVLAGNHSAQAREWEVQGFTIAESTPVFERTAISTAGEPNPNNQGQLATKHNTLDYMSTMVEPQVVVALQPWRAKQLGLDAAAFYFQGFAWWDKAPFLDSALNRVNQSAPSFNRYAGDGWSLNSFGTNELLAEVMDAYLDLRKDFGPASVGLRLGKERQENGNELDRLFRVANVIDSLDFRRDVIFPDPFGSFDSFVIGQWTVQPTLYFNNLPRWYLSDSWITAWVSQFQPDYFPAPGVATSILPSNLVLHNGNTNKAVYGTIAATTVADALDLKLNYYHVAQGFGVSYTPPGFGPCGPRARPGKPALNCQRRTFPTDEVVGGTFNYHIQGLASGVGRSLLTGGSFGGEIEYRPTMTFANPGTPSGTPFIKEGNLAFALSFRNSWPLFSDEYRTFGLWAYEYNSIANPITESYLPGKGDPNGMDLMDIFVAQPLPRGFNIAAAAMPSCFGDGSLRAYGELDYKSAENWIFSVKYDYWGGSASTPASNWGVFSSFDQLVIDVGYTF
jgi:hypothetical protein